MTVDELDSFLDKNQNIIYQYDEEQDTFAFKNMDLAWYRNHEDNYTQITGDKLKELTCKELQEHIDKGLMIEGITRITGYFSKVGAWNPGKIGELKDRHKTDLTGRAC